MTATAEIVVQQVKNALLVPNAHAVQPADGRDVRAAGEGSSSQILPRPPNFRKPSEREGDGRQPARLGPEDGAPADGGHVGATDGARTEILKGGTSRRGSR